MYSVGVPEGAAPRRIRASRYKGTGIIYEELPIDDKEYFQITSFLGQACRSDSNTNNIHSSLEYEVTQ